MLGTEVLVFLRCLAAKVLSVKTDPTNECKLLLILKEGVPVFVKASRIQFCEVCDSLYRLRAKKGPAPPPPREFCRHILS